MPATQRGQAYKIAPGKWGLRYYDRDGVRRRKSPFPSKSTALAYFRDVVEPELRGDIVRQPDLTLTQFIPLFLERHGADVRPRTIATLEARLKAAEKRFGDIPLREMEGMAGEVAAWRTGLPERTRYGYTSALRQCLGAAVRWGYASRNPAKEAGRNPQPSAREIRVFSRDELAAISAAMPAAYAAVPLFVASVGLRPEEWQALERRDVDRSGRVLTVARTVSSGQVVEMGKTARSRRQVPLSQRALDALDLIPARLHSPLLFPAPEGGLLNMDNWRSRTWLKAVTNAGVPTPARIYDLRSTFASEALGAGVSVFTLAKLMGTSVGMIERHYGALLDGAGAEVARLLDAFEARG